jgi:hypothetical protein
MRRGVPRPAATVAQSYDYTTIFLWPQGRAAVGAVCIGDVTRQPSVKTPERSGSGQGSALLRRQAGRPTVTACRVQARSRELLRPVRSGAVASLDASPEHDLLWAWFHRPRHPVRPRRLPHKLRPPMPARMVKQQSRVRCPTDPVAMVTTSPHTSQVSLSQARRYEGRSAHPLPAASPAEFGTHPITILKI